MTLSIQSLIAIDTTPNLDRNLVDSYFPNSELVTLDFTQDIGKQIDRLLSDYSDVQTLHIVSEGDNNSLQFESTSLQNIASSKEANILFHEFERETGTFNLLEQIIIDDSVTSTIKSAKRTIYT